MIQYRHIIDSMLYFNRYQSDHGNKGERSGKCRSYVRLCVLSLKGDIGWKSKSRTEVERSLETLSGLLTFQRQYLSSVLVPENVGRV